MDKDNGSDNNVGLHVQSRWHVHVVGLWIPHIFFVFWCARSRTIKSCFFCDAASILTPLISRVSCDLSTYSFGLVSEETRLHHVTVTLLLCPHSAATAFECGPFCLKKGSFFFLGQWILSDIMVDTLPFRLVLRSTAFALAGGRDAQSPPAMTRKWRSRAAQGKSPRFRAKATIRPSPWQ